MHRSVGAGRAAQEQSCPWPWQAEEAWQRLSSSSGTAPWLCSAGTHAEILPAIILCAGHNLSDKTMDLCLWMLLTTSFPDHPVGFILVGFFEQAGQIENFHIFYQIGEKSSVLNLKALLLLCSHTDSKPIIPSLVSIPWTVCSFEQVFCSLS